MPRQVLFKRWKPLLQRLKLVGKSNWRSDSPKQQHRLQLILHSAGMTGRRKMAPASPKRKRKRKVVSQRRANAGSAKPKTPYHRLKPPGRPMRPREWLPQKWNGRRNPEKYWRKPASKQRQRATVAMGSRRTGCANNWRTWRQCLLIATALWRRPVWPLPTRANIGRLNQKPRCQTRKSPGKRKKQVAWPPPKNYGGSNP